MYTESPEARSSPLPRMPEGKPPPPSIAVPDDFGQKRRRWNGYVGNSTVRRGWRCSAAKLGR
ncbi:Uncharacterised protein [Mycobacteroides abscessus subsp. abscessus]|nr:Uncharacterised protein [Mycobacteroides abscessus subsp. abscessus]